MQCTVKGAYNALLEAGVIKMSHLENVNLQVSCCYYR